MNIYRKLESKSAKKKKIIKIYDKTSLTFEKPQKNNIFLKQVAYIKSMLKNNETYVKISWTYLK